MKTLLIAILMCIPCFLFGAAFMASQSTLWNSSATWGGAGVPGVGDTVDLATFTVTCPAATNCAAGTSVKGYFSYISSITVGGLAPAGNGTCTLAISGGTALNGSGQTGKCFLVGGVITDQLDFPLQWYTVASSAPTASFTCSPTCLAATATVVWQQGSGVAAVKTNSTGKLINLGTFDLRGAMTYSGGNAVTGDYFEEGAGSSITFDSSHATALSDGSFPYYTAGPDATSVTHNQRTWGIYGASPCSAAARCTITSSGAAGSISSANASESVAPQIQYTDITGLGDAKLPWADSTLTTTGGFLDIWNSCTSCGSYWDNSGYAGVTTWIHSYNTRTNSILPNSQPPVEFPAFGALFNTNAPVWIGNVSDIQSIDAAPMLNFTFTDNLFLYNQAEGMFASNRVCNTYKSNLAWKQLPANESEDMNCNTSRAFTFWDPTNGSLINPHDWNVNSSNLAGQPFTLDKSVSEAGSGLGGDSGEWLSFFAANALLNTTSNSIMLHGSDGFSFSEIASSTPSSGNLQHLHDYWYGVYASGVAGDGKFGMQDLEEAGAATDITGLTGSIIFNPGNTTAGVHGGYVALDLLTMGLTQNPITTADYNLTFNSEPTQTACTACLNQGKGYAANWSSAAARGAHDLTGVDPQLIDYKRSILVFDTQYLGVAIAPQWVSGAYSIGAVVSNTVSTVAFGRAVNYRCITTGCGTQQPGATPNTGHAYWEYNVINEIRNRLGIHYTTFVDGNLAMDEDGSCGAANPCSVITASINWIRQGHVSLNPLTWTADRLDGMDIGPSQRSMLQHMPMLMFIQ